MSTSCIDRRPRRSRRSSASVCIGMWQSIRASLRFGHGSLRGLRSKLVEVNLILGILKSTLVVLAMVFWVTPAPFKAEINGLSLYLWWAAVGLAYCIASDFFQMARTIGFIEIWRSVNRASDDRVAVAEK